MSDENANDLIRLYDLREAQKAELKTLTGRRPVPLFDVRRAERGLIELERAIAKLEAQTTERLPPLPKVRASVPRSSNRPGRCWP